MAVRAEEIRTTCTLDCPDRCVLLCQRHAGGPLDGDGRFAPVRRGAGSGSAVSGLVTLRGDPDHPFTRGFTCAKIRRYPGRLVSGERITQPHVRRDAAAAGGRRVGASPSDFVPISWEAAMDLVAGALREALADDPASVLLLRGAGSMGASKLFADWLFAALGARRTKGSLCDEAGGEAIVQDCGRLDMNDPAQIDEAEAIVLWGKHPRACSIHTASQVQRARKRGVPVLAVNPDRAAVTNLADRVVSVRPGSDRFLALAVTKLFLERTTRPVPWDRAANVAAYRRLLDAWSVDELLAACQVSRESATAIVDLFLRTPRVATVCGWGLQRYETGGESVRAIDALCFLAGTLGVVGGGLYYSIPSRRHLRVPRRAPGPEPLSLPLLAAELERAAPPVRFAWIAGLNYLNQTMEAPRARAAFARIPVAVAVDGFWTDTVLASTVVLPPALFLEEDDVVGSYWCNALYAVHRVVAPPAGCRTDFEILQDLASRLGLEVPWTRLEEWLEALLPEPVGGLGRLQAQGWCRMAWPEVAWEDGFGHPDRRFHLVETLTPPEASGCRGAAGGEGLPLLSLIRREAMHSQLLAEEQSEPLAVRLHPETAAELGIQEGADVRVKGVAGELKGRAMLDPLLHPDVVACPRDGWVSLGRGANEATTSVPTDLGDGAAYYSSRVRVMPA